MIYTENILICIGGPLLVTLLFLRDAPRRFVAFFLVGMVMCMLSGYITGYLNLISEAEMENTAVYVSPVVEECMKLLPLLFCVFVMKNDQRALLHVAIAVGAGFATFENCCYILQAGAESFFYTLIRGLSVGVMHIVCMMLLDLGLMMAARLRVFSFSVVIGSLSLSMTFHGLYNLMAAQEGVTAYIGYVLPVLAAGTLYLIFRQIILRKIRQGEIA